MKNKSFEETRIGLYCEEAKVKLEELKEEKNFHIFSNLLFNNYPTFHAKHSEQLAAS